VTPDILCLAKGITGGYLPLAATLSTEEIFSTFLGEYKEFKTFFHGHTYTGNPLGCAAALANLELFERDRVIEQMQPKIAYLQRRLNDEFLQLAHVSDVRQGGFMVGVELVEQALDTYGRLDILVNNAGILRPAPFTDLSEQDWDVLIAMHLKGHFETARAVAPVLIAQQSGRIVNTSSEAFLLGSAGQPNYAAAKAGIAALTLTTARSCSRYGVRANAICPRARTAMTAELMGPAPAGAVPGDMYQHLDCRGELTVQCGPIQSAERA